MDKLKSHPTNFLVQETTRTYNRKETTIATSVSMIMDTLKLAKIVLFVT